MSGLVGYEIRRQIGSGSSGTVWEASRRGPISQLVAVKRLRGEGTSQEVAQLRREAMLLTELDHPHIVRVLEVLEDGEGVAICMQLAPGGSLEALLAARGRLSPGEVVAVAVPVAEALSSAHRRGVLHVDVKPANILFTSDGEPLLGDFGVARTLGRLTAVLGGQGQLAGTAHYLAPELFDGSAPDPRCDVYSLAVVCYEALTGKRPFDAALPLAVLRASDAGAHEPLTGHPDIPAPLARVVEQAMARDPDLRIASAGRLAWELRAAVPQAQIRLPGAVGLAEASPGAPAPGLHAPPPVPPPDAPQMGGPATPPAPTTGPPLPVPPPHAPTAAPTPVGAPTIEIGEEASRDTRTFGPRPPAPELLAPPRRRRLSPKVALAVLAGVGGIAALAYLAAVGLGSGEACPTAERPPDEPGVQVVAGDPVGDGCVVYGTYALGPSPESREDMFLTIEIDGERQRVRLGELGDSVFLGDWNCDGVDTPGVYRWARGEVEYYDGWPTSSTASYRPDETERVPAEGRASVDLPEGGDQPGGDDCERIEVTER